MMTILPGFAFDDDDGDVVDDNDDAGEGDEEEDLVPSPVEFSPSPPASTQRQG